MKKIFFVLQKNENRFTPADVRLKRRDILFEQITDKLLTEIGDSGKRHIVHYREHEDCRVIVTEDRYFILFKSLVIEATTPKGKDQWPVGAYVCVDTLPTGFNFPDFAHDFVQQTGCKKAKSNVCISVAPDLSMSWENTPVDFENLLGHNWVTSLLQGEFDSWSMYWVLTPLKERSEKETSLATMGFSQIIDNVFKNIRKKGP